MRPFFSSFPLMWGQAAGASALKSAIGTMLPRYLPAHMNMVHEDARHLTAFANFKINWWNAKRVTGDQFAQDVVKRLVEGKPKLLADIRDAWRPITLEAYELTCFDSVVAVQFRSPTGETALADFRKRMNELMREPIEAMMKEVLHPDDQDGFRTWQAGDEKKRAAESLCSDPNKNSGGNGFGSVARSPITSEVVVKRWTEEIGPIQLKFPHTFLTASDEALCNPGFRNAIKISR